MNATRAWPLVAAVLWFALLYGVYATTPALAHWVIEHATVRPAAALLGWIDPGLQAQASGARLLAAGRGLQVLPGCEGTDLALLASSAMLAAPVAWRWRLAGLGLALAAVFVLNQARLLALLWAHLHAPQWFAPLHTLWLPLLMVVVLLAGVLAWTARFAPR